MRTRACVASLGPGGWAAATPAWQAAVDFAATRGALGEVAITLRTAAAVAHHLGEHAAAEVLWAAVPRSTAITVLPELFPDSVRRPGRDRRRRARRARTSSPRCAGPAPRSDRCRAAVADAPPRRRTSPSSCCEGDAWRLGCAGRTVRVRDMKGIGDLVVLVEPAAAWRSTRSS